MNTNDIRLAFDSTPQLWSALRPNEYDGAPDAHGIIGWGKTPVIALADLLEQELRGEVFVLDVPDRFEFRDATLVKSIRAELKKVGFQIYEDLRAIRTRRAS